MSEVMSEVEHIKAAVRRQHPDARVRPDGPLTFVVDVATGPLGHPEPTADRAWVSAWRIMQSNT